MNWKNIRQLAGTSALRGWLAFCTLAAIGFVWFWFIDHDNPLQSDDPYLVGFFFGISAACLAIIYTVAESIGRRVGWTQLKDFVYAVLLAAWCLLLWAGSLGGGEGACILSAASVASLVIGLLTYPLCRFDAPRVLLVIMSCMGVLLLTMYCVVCVRMGL